MKGIVLLFCFIFILTNFGICQNVLILNNGDKIIGKLKGCKNDTVVFEYQGNKLKFKTSNLQAIYFDKNKLLSDSIKKECAIKEIQNIPGKEGKIYGVITYFFNYNFGDKSDVGAEVFMSDSTKTPEESRRNSFWYRMQTDIKKTMADGDGNYSVKVKPGTYFLCFKSKHRKRINLPEIDGNVVFEKVVVGEGEEINININFGL